MRKPLSIFILLCLIVNVFPDYSKATEGPQFVQKQISKDMLQEVLMKSFSAKEKPGFFQKHVSKKKLQEALIQRLTGPIGFVVGGDWFRGNEKILEIRKDEGHIDIFYVTVQVVGFQGPHNPPYIEEIITFKLEGYKVKPSDYFNRVIPENQWHEFLLD
jgi:hypothetical protein